MSVKDFCYVIFLCMLALWQGCTTTEDAPQTETTLPIQKTDFQSHIKGKQTHLFVLQNEEGMKVGITNYGGRIVSWLAPDKQGNYDDIALGFDSINGYLNAHEVYFGALIGQVANRIAGANLPSMIPPTRLQLMMGRTPCTGDRTDSTTWYGRPNS